MSEPLRALTASAQAVHADEPETAERLLAQGLVELGQASGEAIDDWLRTAEHVLLAHLGRPERLQEWLDLAQAQQGRGPMLALRLQQVAAALALLEGDHADLQGLGPAERVRVQANPLLACAARGHWAQARLLMALASERTAPGEPVARRALAAVLNNTAAHLRAAFPRALPQAMALMLDAARGSRAAWQEVGGWLEAERADWQLAMCLAHAGQGSAARQAARDTLAACEAHGADDFEHCFAWQALAHAALASDDADLARQARDRMAGLLPALTDDGDRRFAQDALAWIDARLR